MIPVTKLGQNIFMSVLTLFPVINSLDNSLISFSETWLQFSCEFKIDFYLFLERLNGFLQY